MERSGLPLTRDDITVRGCPQDQISDPNERALMMSTVEGYEKLRAALPFAAGTLSAEAVGPLGPRPASGGGSCGR
jgi:hypothetical protein